MKALVKSKAEKGIWLEDVPEPEIGINDVLIKIRKTGICGTDVHIYNWDAWAQQTIPVPLVIGHEFVGEIVEVGSNVTTSTVGDVVCGEGHVVCGRCRNCMAGRRHLCAHTIGLGVNRPGAFAEYVALPMTNIWHHWPGIDEDIAAIFDPFGNAVHTALAFEVLGEDVLITGAGPIGCMAAAVARHAGARHVVVTDINALPRARSRGGWGRRARSTHGSSDLHEVQSELGMTEGFDVGLEMSGNAGSAPRRCSTTWPRRSDRAARASRPRRSRSTGTRSSSTCSRSAGIYGREMYETWYQMTAMLQSGLDITPGHHAPASTTGEFEEGFADRRLGRSRARSLLDWTTA